MAGRSGNEGGAGWVGVSWHELLSQVPTQKCRKPGITLSLRVPIPSGEPVTDHSTVAASMWHQVPKLKLLIYFPSEGIIGTCG